MTDIVEKKDARSIISANINRFMKAKGKSRKEVAEDVGMKYTTLCDWVNARTYPRLEGLEQLAGYFGVELVDFFVDYERNDGMVNRMIKYASKGMELELEMARNLTDEQIKKLLDAGFRFRKKSFEEIVEEMGGSFSPTPDIDWGEPRGREIW